MATKVHLVSPEFFPEDLSSCYFISYAGMGGFEGGLVDYGDRIGIPDEALRQLAERSNREFKPVTYFNFPVTMLPYGLVVSDNRHNVFPPVAIIESMLEVCKHHVRKKKAKSVVLILSNMWNPDITKLHQRWASEGYEMPGVDDLYVWTT